MNLESLHLQARQSLGTPSLSCFGGVLLRFQCVLGVLMCVFRSVMRGNSMFRGPAGPFKLWWAVRAQAMRSLELSLRP